MCKRGHHAKRVHARVGSSGAGDMHWFPFHAADDFFENALNGRQPRLDLPAMKIRAVIGEP